MLHAELTGVSPVLDVLSSQGSPSRGSSTRACRAAAKRMGQTDRPTDELQH